jgi:hypothetical protein
VPSWPRPAKVTYSSCPAAHSGSRSTRQPTGARRSEVSALRENRFDFTRQQVRVSANYIVKQGNRIEKAPTDGEARNLSLDLLTRELLRERFQRRRAEAQSRPPQEEASPRAIPPASPGVDGLAALAAVIAPQAGLEEDTALAWLTEFVAAGQRGQLRANRVSVDFRAGTSAPGSVTPGQVEPTG